MGKKLAHVAAVVAFVVLIVSGCSFAPMEIWGTWTMNDSGDIESLEFCLTSFTLTDDYINPAWDGTLECSYQDIDKSAGHILLEVSDASGWWASFFTEGQTLYMTYDIIGDAMYIEFDTGTYPTTAGWGPYTKE